MPIGRLQPTSYCVVDYWTFTTRHSIVSYYGHSVLGMGVFFKQIWCKIDRRWSLFVGIWPLLHYWGIIDLFRYAAIVCILAYWLYELISLMMFSLLIFASKSPRWLIWFLWKSWNCLTKYDQKLLANVISEMRLL